MKLSLSMKIFLLCALVFLMSFLVNLLKDRWVLEGEVAENRLEDGRDIRGILMATRRVYHKQFISSGLELNEKTLGFLPAHALHRISQEFSHWSASGMTFNNVSDHPRNPLNAADSIEMQALRDFEVNPEKKERLTRYFNERGQPYLHYATPIRTEAYCLECHGSRKTAPPTIVNNYGAGFDYSEGDLRGIMSIKLPLDPLTKLTTRTSNVNAAVSLFTTVIGLAAVWIFLRWLLHSRLEGLLQVADALGRGEQHLPPLQRQGDEFDQVIASYEVMSHAIQTREAALKKSEAWTRGVLDAVSEGIIVVDQHDRVAGFNPAAERLFGYQEDELLGSTFEQLIPERLLPVYRNARAKAIARDPESRDGFGWREVQGRHRDGHEIDIEISLSRLYADTETYHIGVVRDIRERRAADRDLKARAAVQQSILASVSQGIIGLDMHQVCTFCNPAALNMLGLSSEEDLVSTKVLGHPAFRLRGTPRGAQRADWLAEALTQQHEVSWEDVLLPSGEGPGLQVQVRLSPILNGGAVAGHVISLENIERRKQSEQALNDKVVELEQFNRVALGREKRMVDLKREINALLSELGRSERYPIAE